MTINRHIVAVIHVVLIQCKLFSLTLTASWVVDSAVVKSFAVTQLVPAFVVVCFPFSRAHWILIGGTVFETHTACIMGAVCLTNAKRWAFNIEARIKI